MCGITGFFGFEDKQLLKKMTDTLHHRGPDQKGLFSSKDVSLGCARLSILDLERGQQPIFNENKDIVLVFNGEIYNYKQLRQELEEKGHKFYSETDSETIVHCYEQYGLEFVKKLDGMFAFAIWDALKKRLVIARDRTGIKPLYYFLLKEKLFFASELKSLLQYKEFKPTVNYSELSRFLSTRVSSVSGSLISGVKKLPPANLLVSENGQLSLKGYWQPRFNSSNKSLKYYKKQYLRSLSNSVETHLQSDVPLGIFLSGGLDSSALTALASKAVSTLSTFTVGFGLKSDEFDPARRIAEHFSTNHHEVVVSFESIVKNFSDMVFYLDEPCFDPAFVSTFFLSQFAKKKVKVALLGEGNDELFAGYSHYKIGSNYFSFVPEYFKRLAYGNFVSRQAFPTNDLKEILGKDAETNFSLNLASKGTFLDKMLLKELTSFLPGLQLHRVDRMTMGNSLEARVPFLSNKMLDLSLSIPAKFKLNGFNGKFVAKKALSQLLPKELHSQNKRILFTPLSEMFKHGLLDVAEETLLGKETLFDGEGISKLVAKVREKNNSHVSTRLFNLLVFEQWRKCFNIEA